MEFWTKVAEKTVGSLKFDVCLTMGAIMSGVITYLYGEWSQGLTILAILMLMDFATGFIVSSVFKKSAKTEHGGLKSSVMWQGIGKKVLTMIIVALMHLVDVFLGINYLRDMCVFGYVLSEVISITENAGLVIELPPVVTNAIELLNSKAKKGE